MSNGLPLGGIVLWGKSELVKEFLYLAQKFSEGDISDLEHDRWVAVENEMQKRKMTDADLKL